MKLRTKLLLGYVGFVVALAVLGAWSARTLLQMSAVSGRIIAENYDSVVAAQDMKESLERLDSAAMFYQVGDRTRAAGQAAEHHARFDAAFATAAANITEPGEAETIDAIRRGRDDYYRQLDAFLAAPSSGAAQYFRELEPRFNRIRAACDRLLRINQDAMRQKADAASRIARRWFLITLALVAALMVTGVGVEISLSNAILGPVRQLTAATTRVAGGDLEATVDVRSGDEIGELALGFNRMAERIRELRRSDLGKLLVAQQTTEAAIDSLYDPVLVCDAEGKLTRINPAAERLFGARDAVVGRPIAEVARDPRVAQTVSDVLTSGRPVASESAAAVLPWAVDGNSRAFRIRSTPMHDADDRLVGAVTLLEDITHLSEISRMKSEFIAAASHELRTPLTSVQMAVHLLLESSLGPLNDRQQELLQVCREDTARLDRLMRELLDLSKIESGDVTPKREPVRVGALIRDAVESAADAARVARRPDRRGRGAGSAAGDRRPRTDRARRHEPADERRPRDAVWRRDRGVRGRARPRRRGVGGRRRHRHPARVPRPHLRAVHAGAGRAGRRRRSRPADRAAHRRSARRSVERAVRAGQRIDVHVHHSHRRRRPAMKVLVVDDEAHVRRMMALTLEGAGYEVAEAASGEDAVVRYGDGSEWAAVVLDQKMSGIDGLETLRRIRERRPDARVLFVTAFASIELAVDAMRAGATDFLRKPMTPETLRGAVAAALDARSRPAAASPAAGEKPRIETLTLNGFRILREPTRRIRRERAPLPRVRTFTRTPTSSSAWRSIRRPWRDSRAWRSARCRPTARSGASRPSGCSRRFCGVKGARPGEHGLVVRDVSREDLEAAAAWPLD